MIRPAFSLATDTYIPLIQVQAKLYSETCL